jgi:hypothetical protein
MSEKLRARGQSHVSENQQQYENASTPPGCASDEPVDPHIDDAISLYMDHDKAEPLPFFVTAWLRSSEADIYAIFKYFDLDNIGAFRVRGGDLTRPEMEIILAKFGLQEAQVNKFFDLCMLDDDDCITFPEFKKVMKNCNKELPVRLSERVYLMFEDPASCFLAQVISVVTVVLIFISTVAFVSESIPLLRAVPNGCLTDDSISCEPAMSEATVAVFANVEAVCVIAFTVDYVARLFASPWTREHVIGHASRGDANPVFHFSSDIHGDRKNAAIAIARNRGCGSCRLLRFILKPMNVIDFIAIFPFYAEMIVASGGGNGLLVLRLLRLGRVLRLLKLGKRNQGMIIFANAFSTASGVLGLLMFMIVLINILFGSLLYLAEGGVWHEPSDICNNQDCSIKFPDGAYLRQNYLGSELEESPYKSILHSSWAVMTTITTVGYGDLYPTSPQGEGWEELVRVGESW